MNYIEKRKKCGLKSVFFPRKRVVYTWFLNKGKKCGLHMGSQKLVWLCGLCIVPEGSRLVLDQMRSGLGVVLLALKSFADLKDPRSALLGL